MVSSLKNIGAIKKTSIRNPEEDIEVILDHELALLERYYIVAKKQANRSYITSLFVVVAGLAFISIELVAIKQGICLTN